MGVSWFTFLKVRLPCLKVPRSSKLVYYSFFNNKQRIWCIHVCAIFKVLTTFLLLFYGTLDLIKIYNMMVKLSLTVSQFLFAIVCIWINAHITVVNLIMYFLIALTLFLINHIYVSLYRKINKSLKKMAKIMLRSKGGDRQLSLLMISRSANVYRTAHNCLTMFFCATIATLFLK